jgi:tRNA-splicing ligase RtcB
MVQLKQIDEVRWEIPPGYKPWMKVPARIYADSKMISEMQRDLTLEQAVNVTSLQGIYKYSITLPDGHQGYGFPIGGVAATDAETGVISPGGIGYDQNCLPPGTLVLCEFGYVKPIEEIRPGEWVICWSDGGPKPTRVVRVWERRGDKKVLRLVTTEGRILRLTPDHPVLTPEGMKEASKLRPGDKVAVFPFEGVNYEPPLDFIILEEKDLPPTVVPELKKRGLLPLRSTNPKVGLILKLLGYFIGDGSFDGKLVVFYGHPSGLAEIARDLRRLGYTPSKIRSRRRLHRIGGKTFVGCEYSVSVSAKSLVSLFKALGAPEGRKTESDFEVPKWIFRLPLWMKRLFLAGLFGAELNKPQTLNGYNFIAPTLTQSKKSTHEKSGEKFLRQIAALLQEFGVQTTSIRRVRDPHSVRLVLSISVRSESLLALWGRIGYEYHPARQKLARMACEYLLMKEHAIQARIQASELAEELYEVGFPKMFIVNSLTSTFVNPRFLERSLYEGRKTAPRVPEGFPKFEEWISGQSETIWEEIREIEWEDFEGPVYDLTVEDASHNFIANGFVVSNCGVRLLVTNLSEGDVRPVLGDLVSTLFKNVPSGLGSTGHIRLTLPQLDEVLKHGARWAVENGFGWERDLERTEERGCMAAADPSCVSMEAKKRGFPQLGSLGSGNHFLEVQKVDKIYEPEIAKVFGITHEGQVTVMIHTGSRGLGHQVCSDYLRTMERVIHKYNIHLPDRELVNVPFNSPEGQAFFKAMCCSANYAWANRQMITHWVRESFEQVFHRDAEALGLELVYDVAHNIAKVETHQVNGEKKTVVVHRKGATRAFPAGHPDLPPIYRSVGQPVLIPGDMGRASYVLVGTELAMRETFGSTAHGSGRHLSRAAALRQFSGQEVKRRLEERGIVVRAASISVIAEETPEAYKPVDEVVDVTHRAGISRKVARLVPLGVAKG